MNDLAIGSGDGSGSGGGSGGGSFDTRGSMSTIALDTSHKDRSVLRTESLFLMPTANERASESASVGRTDRYAA